MRKNHIRIAVLALAPISNKVDPPSCAKTSAGYAMPVLPTVNGFLPTRLRPANPSEALSEVEGRRRALYGTNIFQNMTVENASMTITVSHPIALAQNLFVYSPMSLGLLLMRIRRISRTGVKTPCKTWE